MSLSRSPSPQPNGGWISRGLTDRDSPPVHDFVNGYSETDDQWAAAKARSQRQHLQKGYPRIQTKNEGFFQRSRRKISAKLPSSLNPYAMGASRDWRHSEKLGRGRWAPRGNGNGNGNGNMAKLKTFLGNVLRKFKLFFIVLGMVLLITITFSKTHMKSRYRSSTRFGGGSKFVIILAANEGGGVMEWKGPREWAIERDSIKNKKNYARRWGYNLEITDMSTKKRYTHEWRESWEKVDTIRNCMARYPHAEWFWWLDLNTFIMEPSLSLQQHIFNDLGGNTYRDINIFNPMKVVHPPQQEFLDSVAASPTGDNQTSSIDIIIPQDCGGFNLGSFFVRRSAWTERLLDIWWDPVLYEQKHMDWEHKEQDALEHLYKSQPYLRTHFAFIPQRKINSFPPGACSEGVKTEVNDNDPFSVAATTDGAPRLDPRFHYNEQDRDFVVNMAGCEWGRDCWAEMYSYRELSYRLNRAGWLKFEQQISAKILNYVKSTFGVGRDLSGSKKDGQGEADDQDTNEAHEKAERDSPYHMAGY